MSRTPATATGSTAWIASPAFDLGLIIGPPLVAVALVLAVPAMRSDEVPVWAWVVFVLAIDVAHVYSSLYRTYFDPEELARRRQLYLLVPIGCFVAGVVVYSLGSLIFWRLLAYAAVYHFVRQQFGLVMVYRHRGGERSDFDRRLDKATIYATMLYPLAFWHADPDPRDRLVCRRRLRQPAGVDVARRGLALRGDLARLRRAPALPARHYPTAQLGQGRYRLRHRRRLVRRHRLPQLRLRLHGDQRRRPRRPLYGPHLALRTGASGRANGPGGTWIHKPAAAGAFVGLLLLLAYAEEGLWDVFVWQEHASVFGGLILGFKVPGVVLNVLVPLLTTPQATHYVLDGWLWKFDGSNPGLREYLFGKTEENSVSSHHFIGVGTLRDGLPEAALAPEELARELKATVEANGLVVVDHKAVSFDGGGLTLVLVLAESHLVFHVWGPEGYGTFDLHVCDYRRSNADKAERLKAALEASCFTAGSATWQELHLDSPACHSI